MNRQDFAAPFAEVLFEVVPSPDQADDLVTAEDLESLRLRLVAVCELQALRMAEDAPVSPCTDCGEVMVTARPDGTRLCARCWTAQQFLGDERDEADDISQQALDERAEAARG